MTLTLYRISEENPYLGTEEEWGGLTLEEAAHKMDDLTGVGADVILADWGERCSVCGGSGDADTYSEASYPACAACEGTGTRAEPWEWTDSETGREVTMRREVF